MQSLDVKMIELDSVVVSTIEETNGFNETLIESKFHFRTKSRLGNQRSYALIMKIIHDRL
jgi:hypothetical protein